MANTLLVNSSQAVAGLGTSSCTVLANMNVKVSCNSTIPMGSGLAVAIKLGSTSKLSYGGAATDPTPTQASIGGEVVIACSAGDIINVILTSSNVVDAVPNAVKTTITLTQQV